MGGGKDGVEGGGLSHCYPYLWQRLRPLIPIAGSDPAYGLNTPAWHVTHLTAWKLREGLLFFVFIIETLIAEKYTHTIRAQLLVP